MEVFYSSRFRRLYKKIQPEIRRLFKEKEKLFVDSPFNPKLKTHKLSGKLDPFWAFSVTNSCRVMFHFADDKTVWFIEIGDHDIYD